MTNDQLAERFLEAASWHLRLSESDASSSEFEAWLADDDNADAWARLVNSWELVGRHANDQKMVSLRRTALGSARAARSPRWRRRAMGVAAAAVLCAVGVGAWRWAAMPDDYATAFGERRIVTLADGSRVSLDSDSEVTVHYTGAARELHLLRGQARFDVAHDVERPFSVVARTQKVIATGTAFNIDMTQQKVLVTLIEGHVVVLDEDKPVQPIVAAQSASPHHPSVELRAGQQLAALPEKTPTIARADITRVVAWTGGQLIFDDEPLSEVVARVDHYTATPIMVADASVGALRISGSFNTGDSAGFLDIVTRYLPVKAVGDGGGRVLLERR